MFDMNEALGRWKRSFRGGCSPEDIEELESHIEELVEDLVNAGMREEEAFTRALARIGTADGIEREFAKVRSWDQWIMDRFRVLDWPLFVGLILVCGIGLAMVYSAVNGAGWNADRTTLFTKQAVWIGLGLACMFAVAQITPARLKRYTPMIYASSVLLLVLVLFFGVEIRGARRWMLVDGVSFQPSVLTLLTVPMMTAWLLENREWAETRKGFATMTGLILLPVLLIAYQPDLGMAALCLGAGWVTLLLSTCRARLARVTCLALPLICVAGWFSLEPYQLHRIYSWLDPETDPVGAGWLPMQVKESVISGGLLGRGWLNAGSNVPERHTDFILSLVAEEFGTVGVIVLLACFVLILYRAFVISNRSRENFCRVLGLGFTGLVCLQLAVNVGVVYGLLPTVGVPLPLVSYGGSSLVLLLVGFGILASIQHQHLHGR